MQPYPLLLGVAFAGLLAGTYSDLKTREVPDWINFGMIFAGLGIRAIYSVALFDYMIVVQGLLGLGLFFLVASLMYYGGQWGGGDAKMLMGLGSLMGLDIPKAILLSETPDLLIFWVILLLVGAVYGFAVSIYLSIKHRKAFKAEFMPIFKTSRIRLGAALAIALIACGISLFMPDAMLKMLFLGLAGVVLFTYLLWVYVKAVEKACMLKDLPVDRLTEGDWIAEDVVIDKKRICGPKDLGIERKQIEVLKKLAAKGKVKTVRVKEGIAFLPPFLISFILTWMWPIKVYFL